MLEVDVLHAKAKKRRLFVLIVLIASIFVAALALLLPALKGADLVDRQEKQPVLEESSFVSKSSVSKDKQQQSQTTTATSVEELPVDSSLASKEAFFALYAKLDTEVIPSLEVFPRLVQSARIQQDINDSKEAGATSVAMLDYGKALRLTQSLIDRLEHAKTIEQEAIDELNTGLIKAWDKKQLVLVQNILDQMQLVFPNDPAINQYQQLLDDWPVVDKLHQAAKVANAQGEEQKALESFQQLNELNHDLVGIDEKIAQLENSLSAAKERELLRSLRNAVDNKQLKRARELLAIMRKEGIAKHKSAHLLERLKLLEDEFKLEQIITDVDNAIAQDNWLEALRELNKNKRRFANSERFSTRLETVSSVTSAIKSVAKYINNSDLLLNSRYRKKALSLVTNSTLQAALSNSLANDIKRIKALLDSYNTKVSITVHSDRETFVQVKSVGIVGQVKRKTIELLPGKYIFEGKKDGYVVKRIEVDVKPLIKSTAPIVVTVVADEQI